MNCTRFGDLLADFLDQSLSVEDSAAAHDHLSRCLECRTLLQIVRDGVNILPMEEPEQFSDLVLARTSGAACPRVESCLWDFVAGEQASDEMDLVIMHLRHCPACKSMAAKMGLLRETLPAMSDIDPGESFAISVVGHIRSMRRPQPSFKARFHAWWQCMVQRPLFSLEVAYIATLLMFFVFSPVLPFREMAVQTIPAVWAHAKDPASSRLQSLTSTLSLSQSEFTGSCRDIWKSTEQSVNSMLSRSIQNARGWQREGTTDLKLYWQKLKRSIEKK